MTISPHNHYGPTTCSPGCPWYGRPDAPHTASRAVSGTSPDDIPAELRAELDAAADWVWVGDLSGFQVQGQRLVHRCGWDVPRPRHGYLGNLVEQAQRHRAEGCA